MLQTLLYSHNGYKKLPNNITKCLFHTLRLKISVIELSELNEFKIKYINKICIYIAD